MKRMLISTLLSLGVVMAPGAYAKDILKIGVVAPLTGPGAGWGLAIDGGARIAAAQVNETGGLKIGDKAYEIEVISYDDHYKPADTVTAVNRLLDQDKVKFIVGPLNAASLLAVRKTTDANKVILMTNTYTRKALEGTEYIFRVLPTTYEFLPPYVTWLKENRPELKRVAFLAPNDETGWDSQSIQKDVYSQKGYEVTAAEFFERSQTDFRAVLTKILISNPDFIELDTVPPPLAGLIIRQARELGFDGSLTKFGGVDVDQIVKAAGVENAEGMLGNFAADPNGEAWKNLEKEYAKYHDNTMGDFTFFFYDGTKILLDGIQAAQTIDDADAVRKAIEDASPFNTLLGKSFWGGEKTYGVNRQLFTPVFLGEIVNGKGKIISKLEAIEE